MSDINFYFVTRSLLQLSTEEQLFRCRFYVTDTINNVVLLCMFNYIWLSFNAKARYIL